MTNIYTKWERDFLLQVFREEVRYAEELDDKDVQKIKVLGLMDKLGLVCPKCLKPISTYPAISRRDNKTEICSDCGTAEALEDFARAKGGEKK